MLARLSLAIQRWVIGLILRPTDGTIGGRSAFGNACALSIFFAFTALPTLAQSQWNDLPAPPIGAEATLSPLPQAQVSETIRWDLVHALPADFAFITAAADSNDNATSADSDRVEQVPAPQPIPQLPFSATENRGEGGSGEGQAALGHQWTSIETIEKAAVERQVFADRQPVRLVVADVLARMLSSSRQLQQLQIRPAEGRQLINLEYGAFDPAAFVDSQFDVQNVQQKRERNLVTAGLRKNHVYGGRFELSQGLGVQDNVIGFNSLDQGTANLNFIYTQELLRDGGRDVVLSRSLIASYQYDQLSAQALAESNTLVEKTVTLYWQLYQARANYWLKAALVDWAERLYLQIEERSRHVELALNSLEQARALWLDAQAELVDARIAVLQTQDSLFRLVNDPRLDSNFVELLTAEPPVVSTLQFDPQFEIAAAFQDRPEIRDRLGAIREAAVELRVASNQILPKLSLSLASTLNGFDSGRDYGGAFGNLDQQPASATAGANFEMFLNNRTARARNKQSQLQLSRLQLQYEDQLQAIREEVLLALRVVNNSLPKIQLRALALSSRQREIDAIAFNTWINPAEGVSMVSQLEQLFQAINRLVRTQEELVAAKTELQVSVLALQRAKGALVSASLLPSDIDVPIPQPLQQLRRERSEKEPWIVEAEQRIR